ncbi:MAG: hypothetical protein ACLSHW_02415 [Lachnospiraceae bacterium]
MKKDWENVTLMPEFDEQGVACYRLDGGDYLNEYYVVSEAETRKLLNTPEIVGYEVYNCLIPSTSQMLYYLKEQKKVTTANILSILRGALNYPLEESCYREHIRVHDISFLSSERVFQEEEIAGLEIKYSKLTMVPDSTLMIGDIIASGETLIHCLRYVTDFYRRSRSKTSEYHHLYDRRNEGNRDPRGSDRVRSGSSGRNLKDLSRFIMKESSERIRIRVFPASTFRMWTSTGRAVSWLRNFVGRHFPCAVLCLKNVSSMMAVRDVTRFMSM